MSDSEASATQSGDEDSPLGELNKRQNKEKKDLRVKVTSMKRSVTTNDKKKKKEMTAQIEKLEADLKVKHEKEVAELTSKIGSVKIQEPVADSVDAVAEAWKAQREKTANKNQKKHEKKAAELKRKQELAAQDEANAATSRGNLETEAINEELKRRNLTSHEIAPDGDCLFNAVAHQLQVHGGSKQAAGITGANLRARAADFLRENAADFLPFLTDDDGEVLTDKGFQQYCKNIESTSAEGGVWGGSCELNAISKMFKKKIEVIQPNQQPTVFGDDFKGKPLVLTFHRHAYNLGEHYNSTVPAV